MSWEFLRDSHAIHTQLSRLWGRPGARPLPGRFGCGDFQRRGTHVPLPLFPVAAAP